MQLDKNQLLELKKRLEADMAAVDKLLAIEADADFQRVAAMLHSKSSAAAQSPPPKPFVLSPTPNAQGYRKRTTAYLVANVASKLEGRFTSADVDRAVHEQYPDHKHLKTRTASALFQMKNAGRIKEISPRRGSSGAVYENVK